MAGKKKFKPFPKGLAKLMNSPKVLADLERRAKNVARAADRELAGVPDKRPEPPEGHEDYAVDTNVKKLPRASVRTHSHRAVHAEATDHVLAKTWKAAARD